MNNQSTPRSSSRWNAAVTSTRQRMHGLPRKVASIAAAVLAVFMGYHVFFGQNGITAYQHKRQDEKLLQQQMQQLDLENARLRDQVERLQSDPGAIENKARAELHYTRAGEVIYTLPPDPTPVTTSKR